jgi:hypothetical protein
LNLLPFLASGTTNWYKLLHQKGGRKWQIKRESPYLPISNLRHTAIISGIPSLQMSVRSLAVPN